MYICRCIDEDIKYENFIKILWYRNANCKITFKICFIWLFFSNRGIKEKENRSNVYEKIGKTSDRH